MLVGLWNLQIIVGLWKVESEECFKCLNCLIALWLRSTASNRLIVEFKPRWCVWQYVAVWPKPKFLLNEPNLYPTFHIGCMYICLCMYILLLPEKPTSEIFIVICLPICIQSFWSRNQLFWAACSPQAGDLWLSQAEGWKMWKVPPHLKIKS